MNKATKFLGLGESRRDHVENCPVCLNELDSESCAALERALEKDDWEYITLEMAERAYAAAHDFANAVCIPITFKLGL